MNRDDVLRMATEAGLGEFGLKDFCFYQPGVAGLERFVARIESAVRADEREECARVCDEISDDRWKLYSGEPPYSNWQVGSGDDYIEGQSEGANQCAKAIRARGNNEPT